MKEKICLIIILFVCINDVFASENLNNIEYKRLKEKPCYEYLGNESIEKMRERTVQVMRDTLTFIWSPKKSFSYTKTSAGAGEYNFSAEKWYANLPYTNGGSGIFQWLHFYDYRTGRFDYNDWANIGKKLGNSCAASVIWSTSATCSSIAKGFSGTTATLTINNGWQPLGNYKYPMSLDSYQKFGTDKIISMNSKEIMFEAYALLDKADVLVWAKTGKRGGHAMMAIDKAVVVRNPKTKLIDGKKSYILIQDQGGGNDLTRLVNGQTIFYRGSTNTEYTFDKLLKKCALPMTTLEYKGIKAFEKSYCELKGEYSDLESLQKCRIETNYRLAVIIFEIKSIDGAMIYNTPFTINGKLVSSGKASNFPLEIYLTNKVIKEIKSKKLKYTVKLWATLSNGKDYVLVDTSK